MIWRQIDNPRPCRALCLIKPFDPGELLRAINATARDEQS
jgi:hypothetical protein